MEKVESKGYGVMDGDSGDDGRDELTLVKWKECEFDEDGRRGHSKKLFNKRSRLYVRNFHSAIGLEISGAL